MGQGELLQDTLRWVKGADKDIEEASRRRERFTVVVEVYCWDGDFRKGDVLLVDPSRKVRRGDYFVFRDGADGFRLGRAHHQYRGVRYWYPVTARRGDRNREPLSLPVAGVVETMTRKL